MPIAAALVAQGLVFWAIVALLPATGVHTLAWALLFVAGLATTAGLAWRGVWHGRPGPWLALACYAVLLAAIFAGADFALDAVKGAHRPKARVAESLGGLELWFALCPGLLALAVGGAVRAGFERARR